MQLEMVARKTRLSSFEPGRLFFSPGEAGEVLYLLVEGRMQLYRLSLPGKKLIVSIVKPGGIFGQDSFTSKGCHTTFAESLDEGLLHLIYRADVEAILANQPKVALRFIETMTDRLSETAEKLADLVFKRFPSRLAALLLDHSESMNGHCVLIGYTHNDLSEMLGAYRESVTHILNVFRRQGWIAIRRKRIDILDEAELAALSDRQPKGGFGYWEMEVKSQPWPKLERVPA